MVRRLGVQRRLWREVVRERESMEGVLVVEREVMEVRRLAREVLEGAEVIET